MGKDWLSHLGLVLLFLSSVTGINGEPHYLVLVPSLLHTEITEKVCLFLSNLNETVTASATLEFNRLNGSIILSHQVDKKDAVLCLPFTIPRLSKLSEVAFFTVQVNGPTQMFSKRKTVLVKNSESLVFIQTDKPIYKPRQTVQFRIVSVDGNFRPLNELFPVVYIEDPKRNRIMQWQNLNLEGGLKQLSFPLSSEPLHGSYKVVVQKELGGSKEHSFKVDEFVLPKFEVQVKVPNKITISDEELTVSVCGRYTYGEPVSGLASVSVCRKYSEYSNCYGQESENVCEEFSKQLDGLGCASQKLKTKVFQLKRNEFEMKLHVTAKITEEGTEMELTGTGSCELTDVISKVSFVNVDSHYRHGIPFFGQVLLVDGKDEPIPNEHVSITVMESNQDFIKNYTTDAQGLVQFSFDTDNFTSPSISLTAKYKERMQCYGYMWKMVQHHSAHHTIKHVFSLSKSYVYIEPVFSTLTCGQNQEIRVHYILNGQALKELKELTFYYLFMAKGLIVGTDTVVLPLKPGDMKGTFLFSIPVESTSAPIMRVLIYTILQNGEVVADSKKFNVENCFANKVDLSFSSAKSLPSLETHLKVQASPQSLCALRAVDESVLLLHPEEELTPQMLYEQLSVKDLTGFPSDLNVQEEDIGECTSFKNIFINGITYSPVSNSEEDDAYNFLRDMGLKVFTNAQVQKPHLCSYHPRHMSYEHPGIGGYEERSYSFVPLGVASSPRFHTQNLVMVEDRAPAETVRKHFPETWIWDLITANSAGEAEVVVKVPDTITQWKAGAFCLSGSTGLGLSPTASLIAFKPFFLSLTLPYSVIRGEAFTLKATVFNYLPHCIRVKVQLKDSPTFLAVPKEEGDASHCVCGNQHQTFSWAVTPNSLGKLSFTTSAEAVESQELCHNEKAKVPESGRKDTVIRDLLVEPEGIEKEEAFNSMLCPTDAELSEQISLNLPPNVVEGSARAYFSVLGDILGSAVRDTQNLLKMPYGCGEQNMALFAPNIYVLDYLNQTKQLTPEIKSKAVGFLQSGYQRQLNYKHPDGSYSTFPHSESNTWLTAFVLKSFAQSRPYIFIDEDHINQALIWLSQKQKENGCFQSSGSLLNNALKGGVDDELTLSAYITISLLEIPLPNSSIVRNALFCLESAWKTQQNGVHRSNVYTKALLAYVFALAGNQDKRKEVLVALEKEAVKKDDSVHWERPERPQTPAGPYSYHSLAPSAEVEMTSYVLLAYLTGSPIPSPEDLSMASQIVKWISKQQNPNGGFSSTQDTVVALQALSRYGTATYSKRGKPAEVTIQSSGGFSEKFQVDSANRLLLQQVPLPGVPREYTAVAKGEGCVYLKTSLKYNVHVKKADSPFHLSVETIPPTCNSAKVHKTFQISFNASYKGSRPVSNMVIIDVKMVSGFIPVKPSVKKLVKSGHLSKTEVSTNHVLLYVEKMTNETLSFAFTVTQDIPVKDLKPAVVKIYDYYETDELGVTEYHAPCSADGNA
ncbi:alpha-2-macroglobulin-like isoform X2 [Dromiciops gliroides]|uniref:alpha-2-macroglobulin-like isoform X2 n=1 Tax=Dromiciops gliroides TaxID=33562 RepID=UPI001CC50207|nr:alpha-2-macroglobulin-like isoform X2 [Dromiciops gliroides]